MSKPYGKNYENATIEDYEDLMAEERNCINKELEAKRNARAFPDMAAQFESHYQYLFNLEKAIADRRWELDKQYPAETARIKAKVEAAELSKKIDKELQEYEREKRVLAREAEERERQTKAEATAKKTVLRIGIAAAAIFVVLFFLSRKIAFSFAGLVARVAFVAGIVSFFKFKYLRRHFWIICGIAVLAAAVCAVLVPQLLKSMG